MGDRPPPPKHLSVDRRKLWTQILSLFELSPDELALFEQALVALDRCAEARLLVERDGLTTPGRFGPRTNPAVLIERDAALLASRLFRQFRLSEVMAELHKAPDRRVSPARLIR